MIKGEEHLPMSLVERISDEPLEPMAYLDYTIKWYRGHLKYWSELQDNPEDPLGRTKSGVIHHLQIMLMTLETMKIKLNSWPRASVQSSSEHQPPEHQQES